MDTKQERSDALDAAAEHYDLGHWRNVQPVGTAFRIVAERGEFMAAVSDGRSDASLRFEAMLLAHLADRVFAAPRLVRTRAGRPWHRSATGTAVLVTEWAQGGEVDASLAQHRGRSVRALAEYHSAVRSFPSRLRAAGGPTLFALEHDGLAALEAFTDISGWYLDADGRQRLRSAASFLWRRYMHVPEVLHAGGRTLPRLVIHGDFGPSAVLIDQPKCGATWADGLVGFSKARYDARSVDLAAALNSFARVAGVFDLDRCAASMAAYGEIERLSPGEVEALPSILSVERLARIFRMTSDFGRRFEHSSDPESAVARVFEAVESEAIHLRWMQEHEQELSDALCSSLVA